ncbi:hypothetical protein FHT76_001662 [Rhizobium sp. BK176]|nr:hypothetical protein [Rhizobium sp. BK176]
MFRKTLAGAAWPLSGQDTLMPGDGIAIAAFSISGRD